MELVNLNTYDHLKLIPVGLMSGQEVVWKVLWTIINHLGKLHFTKCVEQFKKATNLELTDYFEFAPEDVKQFLD